MSEQIYVCVSCALDLLALLAACEAATPEEGPLRGLSKQSAVRPSWRVHGEMGFLREALEEVAEREGVSGLGDDSGDRRAGVPLLWQLEDAALDALPNYVPTSFAKPNTELITYASAQ